MLVPNSTSTVSLLSAKGQGILASPGAPARKWRARGRIEHTLLDGEFSVRPNRPETFARNHTIPQKVTYVSIYDKRPEPRRSPAYYPPQARQGSQRTATRFD